MPTKHPLKLAISRRRKNGGWKMTQKRLPTVDQLKEMAQIDIHTVEKESLVSAEDIQIHTELPDKERLEDYIRQIKNVQ